MKKILSLMAITFVCVSMVSFGAVTFCPLTYNNTRPAVAWWAFALGVPLGMSLTVGIISIISIITGYEKRRKKR